jgi:hypothetical protein
MHMFEYTKCIRVPTPQLFNVIVLFASTKRIRISHLQQSKAEQSQEDVQRVVSPIA